MPSMARTSTAPPTDRVAVTRAVGGAALWAADTPAVVRAGDAAACRAVLSTAVVERRLLAGGTVFPQARLVRPGGTLHPRHYTTPTTPWGMAAVRDLLAPAAVLQRMRDGYGVALGDAHRWHAPLAAWVWGLEGALHRRITANIYRTDPRAPAFPPHYDQQDVVALQVEGRKRWRVHAPVLPWPTHHHPCPREGVVPGPVVLDAVLEPGDLLVLPRGFVHEAIAVGGPSLHVSLSALPWTLLDLAASGGAPARADQAEARRHVSLDLRLPGGGLADPAQAAAADALLDRFVSSRQPDLEGVLADLSTLDAVGPASALAPRRSLVRLRREDDTIRVVAPGRTLELPGFAEPALHAVFSGPSVAGALPDVTPDEGVSLARHLLSEGLLTRPAASGEG